MLQTFLENQKISDSSRAKPTTLNCVIHSFSASRSALKGQCGEQAGSMLVVPLGKALSGIPPP